MAGKSKTRTSRKKTGTKKKKGVKTQAGLIPRIGVISTITVPQALKTAFRNGLNNPNVKFEVRRVGSYRRAKLKRIIDEFNNDTTIGLIMTVGGLVAYEAANALATKPFISLVGINPTNARPNCLGGVTLQSFQSNPNRIGNLESKGFSKSEIGLFRNPNSAMASAEESAWTGATPVISGGADANGDNDASTYPAAFNGIPAGIKALVMSADPFFQETKDDLVKAANGSGRFICYPLQDYGNASPAPTAGKTTLFGPKLSEPFTLLGERAAKALATGVKLVPLFASVPDTVRDL